MLIKTIGPRNLWAWTVPFLWELTETKKKRRKNKEKTKKSKEKERKRKKKKEKERKRKKKKEKERKRKKKKEKEKNTIHWSFALFKFCQWRNQFRSHFDDFRFDRVGCSRWSWENLQKIFCCLFVCFFVVKWLEDCSDFFVTERSTSWSISWLFGFFHRLFCDIKLAILFVSNRFNPRSQSYILLCQWGLIESPLVVVVW